MHAGAWGIFWRRATDTGERIEWLAGPLALLCGCHEVPHELTSGHFHVTLPGVSNDVQRPADVSWHAAEIVAEEAVRVQLWLGPVRRRRVEQERPFIAVLLVESFECEVAWLKHIEITEVRFPSARRHVVPRVRLGALVPTTASVQVRIQIDERQWVGSVPVREVVGLWSTAVFRARVW